MTLIPLPLRRFWYSWAWSWAAESATEWGPHADEGRLIGEDEDGNWYAHAGWGRWVRLDLRRPTHLAAFLRSRRQRRAVMLERGA